MYKFDKQKYISKNKMYVLYEALFIIGWLVFFLVFLTPYKELNYFMNKDTGVIMQLLFILNSYLNLLLLSLLSYFVLLAINLQMLLMYYVRNRREKTGRGYIKKLVGFILLTLGIAIVPLLTPAWPFFLVVAIAASTVAYVTYVITNHISEEVLDVSSGLVKKLGPFETESKMNKETVEFISYWISVYETKNLKLISQSKLNDENQYFSEIIACPVEEK